MEMFEHRYVFPEGISPRLEIAWRQIEFVRNYTLTLLDGLTEDDWFWSPPAMSTHIAWQIGHIAVSQYGLTLFRQRGRADIDGELMSSKFRKFFMRGTDPNLDRSIHPSVIEIKTVLERVFDQMRIELPSFDGALLDEPADAPHAAFATRYGSLLFAASHEMLHAGQIGLIRRLRGKEPLR